MRWYTGTHFVALAARAADPLDGVQLGNLQQRVQMPQRARPVQMVDAVVIKRHSCWMPGRKTSSYMALLIMQEKSLEGI